MSAFQLRMIWPIVDPSAFPNESIAAARALLPRHAEARNVVFATEPTFKIIDCTPAQIATLKTATAVVGEVDVVPVGTPIPRPQADRPAEAEGDTVDPLITQLTELRTRHGYTTAQLEVLAGVSWGSLAKVEQGQRIPQLNTLRALADVLDCDITLTPRDPS